jgi:hypothetical protein
MSQSSIDLTAENFQAPKSLDRIQMVALVVGIVGIAAAAFGYTQNPDQFFRSYLKAYVFWLSIPLGCLGFLMLQHLSQGAWGLIPRRLNEAAGATLLLMAPLFIPIWFGLTSIFAWARPEVMAENHLIAKKAWYLDPEFFLLRVVIYFAVWLLLTFALRRQSNRQDRGATEKQIHTMRNISGPGLVIFVALATFVAVDFLMSIDAEYYSSIYGAYFLVSCAIAGMAFLILMESHLAQRQPMAPVLTKRIFHDQGKLLLAFTMVWAYFCVSQFLITWQGNLPEEVIWYEHRLAGGWDYVAVALALCHFALPFLLLLSRPLKRNNRTLSVVAILLLVVHWMDYQWQVAPHFHHHATVSWIDLATMAGVGGLWLWFFVLLFKRRPILSYNDPYLPEALDHA